MTRRVATAIACLICVSCTDRGSLDADDGNFPLARFSESSRGLQVVYSNMTGTGGVVCGTPDPDRSVLECFAGSFPYSSDAIWQWTDCSSQSVRCAKNVIGVFAVPKDSVAVNERYFYRDAEYNVLYCRDFEAETGRCTLFLIAAREMIPINDTETIQSYSFFFYSPDRGVVSYGGRNVVPCVLLQERFLGDFVWGGVLVTQSGLLSDNFHLPKSTEHFSDQDYRKGSPITQVELESMFPNPTAAKVPFREYCLPEHD